MWRGSTVASHSANAILAAALQRASGSTFSGRQQCRTQPVGALRREPGGDRAAFMANARQQLYGSSNSGSSSPFVKPTPTESSMAHLYAGTLHSGETGSVAISSAQQQSLHNTLYFAPLTLSVASPSTFKVSCDGPLAPGAVEVARTTPGAIRNSDGVWELPLSQHVNFCVAMQQRRIVCERIPQRVLNQLATANATDGRSASNSRMDDDGYARTLSSHDAVDEVDAVSDIPRSVWSALAPFQRAGVSWIVNNNGRALLADEPGLGKTIQAIGAACAYRHEWPVLIVSPSSARFHWEAEFRQWLPDDTYLPGESLIVLTSEKGASHKYLDNALVIIISYDLVHREAVKKVLMRIAPNVVICDECHYLKNGKAQRTKALLPMLKAAKRAILLSGTPALSRPIEIFWQLHALDPNQWADFAEFHKRYCSGSKSKGGGSSSTSGDAAAATEGQRRSGAKDDGKYSAASHLEELHTLLRATLMLRRTKAAILTQLPVKRRIRRRVAIDDPELAVQLRAELEEFRERASELAELSKSGGVGSKTARQHRKRFKSADDDDEDYFVRPSRGSVLEEAAQRRKEMAAQKKALLMELFRRSGQAKLPAIERRVNTLLGRSPDASEHADKPFHGKLLIFAHHRSVLDAIASGSLRDVAHIRIDGSTPAKERQARVNRFQNEADVLVALLSITAAGVALTLTAASRVIFAELYWTPAALLQAEDRVHRIGQTSEVVIEYLLADDSVDDVLWPCIQHKMLLLGELFENQKQHTMRATDDDSDGSLSRPASASTGQASPSSQRTRKRKTASTKRPMASATSSSSKGDDFDDDDWTSKSRDEVELIELEELEELHHEDPEALDVENLDETDAHRTAADDAQARKTPQPEESASVLVPAPLPSLRRITPQPDGSGSVLVPAPSPSPSPSQQQQQQQQRRRQFGQGGGCSAVDQIPALGSSLISIPAAQDIQSRSPCRVSGEARASTHDDDNLADDLNLDEDDLDDLDAACPVLSCQLTAHVDDEAVPVVVSYETDSIRILAAQPSDNAETLVRQLA